MPPFTAPEEFRKACQVSSREQYDEMYKRSIEDPEGFWGDIANDFHWEKKARPLVFHCLPLCVRCIKGLWQGATLMKCAPQLRIQQLEGRVQMHRHAWPGELIYTRPFVEDRRCVLDLQWEPGHFSYNFDVREGPIYTSWFKGATTNMCAALCWSLPSADPLSRVCY